jgi:hypothetical protein
MSLTECRKTLGFSYLRHSVPYLDETALPELRDVMPVKALDVIQVSSHGQLVNNNSSDALLWRRRIKSIVEGIISPDPITWMDDDDNISDNQYTKRVFDEIRSRFTK